MLLSTFIKNYIIFSSSSIYPFRFVLTGIARFRLNTTKYVIKETKSIQKCLNSTKEPYPHCPQCQTPPDYPLFTQPSPFFFFFYLIERCWPLLTVFDRFWPFLIVIVHFCPVVTPTPNAYHLSGPPLLSTKCG